MRSVFVFPRASLDDTIARIAHLAALFDYQTSYERLRDSGV
jgi:thioester reductase-like protein